MKLKFDETPMVFSLYTTDIPIPVESLHGNIEVVISNLKQGEDTAKATVMNMFKRSVYGKTINLDKLEWWFDVTITSGYEQYEDDRSFYYHVIIQYRESAADVEDRRNEYEYTERAVKSEKARLKAEKELAEIKEYERLKAKFERKKAR